ncbi:selenocysteine synthase [Rosistilla carotiformis]|uniref:Selenocysteine synthase n=1 Tax=Rosistilla carotiformis TaxID=2528017 RepID=A0A518JUG7_9BACT|nr:hypothetical protein [Rosistilla carotiformis]QDV69194.1 selenocysteine synthase [Rosistilla carotiformis]
MNLPKQNLSEWASEFLEERLSQAAATIRKPELANELRTKIGDVLNILPGAAAREVERLLEIAKQHAASLAERIHPENSINTVSINASGTLMLGGCGVPASAAVQHPLMFHATHQNQLAGKAVHRALQTVAMSLSGQHILVADSMEAAIVAVAKAAQPTVKILVPRCQAIELPSGISLPDLLRSAGRTVIEVGSVDGWSIDSVLAELRDEASSSVLVTADRIVDGVVGDAAATGRTGQTMPDIRHLLHVAPYVAPRPLDNLVQPALPTLKQRCHDGVLITAGDGLLGGPALGLILGDNSRLQQIAQTRDWCWLQADLTAQATMILAMQTWVDGPVPEGSILAMLETTHANLVDRGIRLKNRLELAGYHVTVNSDQVSARLWPTGRWALPSVELEIRRGSDASESSEAFAQRLETSRPLLFCKTLGDATVVDLRWVAPALDATLAKVIIGTSETPPADPPSPEPASSATI